MEVMVRKGNLLIYLFISFMYLFVNSLNLFGIRKVQVLKIAFLAAPFGKHGLYK